MVGSLPVSHGLFVEHYSKGGQLSPRGRDGKGQESLFAFSTVECCQLCVEKKEKEAKVHL